MKTGVIDWAVKLAAMNGETECGDGYVVKEVPDGVLVCAIDGLGHGPDAAAATEQAIIAIEENATHELVSIVHHCHKVLLNERGVVMSLVKLDNARTLSWLGVGNVEVKLFRWSDNSGEHGVARPVLMSGVVGSGRLPSVYATSVPVRHNDLLILTTDGIEPGFAEVLDTSASPEEIAEDIFNNYVKQTDDALVLVGRYLC